MNNIRDFMAGDHRYCDEVFVDAERAVAAQAWDSATAAFTQFQNLVLQHFAAEEALLFPAFEEKTGMRMGPTQVMRGEHVQMRQLMDAARQALLVQDADDYSGYAETLLIMMQQHNMKEENVLYPMCDQHLSGQTDVLLPQMKDNMPGRAD
ncbi:MAG: hemerythrin [Burkholderiales bacterium RIFCSPLOWO2_12_FULL_61_40]|nr:MAG: hemerythrin [Burkholderiales bacterium RIFCSPLOWO2_12_FULL_61_40]